MLFHQLTSYFESLEKSSGRLKMYSVLGEIFKRASSSEIAAVAYLCGGRLLPAFSGVEIGMGEQLLIRAIAAASSKTTNTVKAAFNKMGDLGLVVEKMITPEKHEKLSLLKMYGVLRAIARTSGPGSTIRKIELLASLIRRCSPVEARFLVRFVAGRWRLGVGPLTVLEAVARCFPESKTARADLERAYNLCSDLGLVLKNVRQNGLSALQRFRVQVGHPVRMMMAERLPSAEAIIERLRTCSVESKLDGFRCELQIKNKRVEIFSRNMERTTLMFPDLVAAARKQLGSDSAILDGEAVAINDSTGEFYPFQITVQRKRKHAVAEMAREFPLVLFAFDLLYANGTDYTRQSYQDRRKVLERLLLKKGRIRVVERVIAKTPAQLQCFFDEQVERGLEGVVAKRLDASYKAGARNFNWIKLKQTYETKLSDTVDAVIVGYLRGRGVRARLGIGAILVSAYDAKTDTFPTVAKVGSGFSEEEWTKLRTRLDEIRVPCKPARVIARITPTVWTEPKYVVSILADQVTRSPVHTCGLDESGSGLALRFPRVVGSVRDDKSPEDATTVREIKEMSTQVHRSKHRKTTPRR